MYCIYSVYFRKLYSIESGYLDEETKETYLKDIRSGEERHRHIRVAIIGEKGVGKTCLLRRLLKQSIEGVQSTDGVNIEVSKCKIRLRDGKWESYKGMTILKKTTS